MGVDPKYRHALGVTIRKKRKSQDLTQEELSELVDLSRRWIQKVESGRSNPNWLNFLQIMVVLELDPTDLAREVGIVVSIPSH
ncbi:MAG: helix-turn-helix transcriptional regulator [Provencibacterium sp.]|jgi:transcriptional regulator with XRE-family HTH domain|nr:helix-turn-helix transcriptional regulator [Provencibacterium sp.]